MDIVYKKGDLFQDLDDAYTVIPHICNNIGKWGSGFVIPLGKRFPNAQMAYLGARKLLLGDVQIVVDKNVAIANMIAQAGIARTPKERRKNPPIRYISLYTCMTRVLEWIQCTGENYQIKAPMFGTERAGGDWNIIKDFIKELWCANNIPVIIYQLEK